MPRPPREKRETALRLLETEPETSSVSDAPPRNSDVIDLVTERLEDTVGTCREVHDAVDEEDPTSADLLHQIIDKLEQYAWMVSAENRVPTRG